MFQGGGCWPPWGRGGSVSRADCSRICVHVVLGGFHLAPMPLDYVKSTVAELKAINPDYLIPMHCSGTPFYEIAKQEMPGREPLSATGTRFVFGA